MEDIKNLSNNQSQNKNIFLKSNQMINPLDILNQEVKNLDINQSPNKGINPLFNLNKDKFQIEKQLENQRGIINQKSESFIFHQSNSPNIQNLTKKTIITCFLSKQNTLYLQDIINKGSKEIIDIIVKELTGTFASLIKNKNGNYFCSDLFKVCEQIHRISILRELSKTISNDCNDKYASHPLQNIIEYSSCEEEYNLILFSFYDYNKTLIACLDPNGSFVIQKIIKHIPEKFREKFKHVI